MRKTIINTKEKQIDTPVDQKHPQEQDEIGYAYAMGIGVEQNLKTAVKWFRLAAKKGDANAQYNLGYCYWLGYGVSQNYKKAEEWWKLAVKQNHLMALDCLVGLYEDGYIVPQPKEFGQILEWSKLLREQTAA